MLIHFAKAVKVVRMIKTDSFEEKWMKKDDFRRTSYDFRFTKDELRFTIAVKWLCWLSWLLRGG